MIRWVKRKDFFLPDFPRNIESFSSSLRDSYPLYLKNQLLFTRV